MTKAAFPNAAAILAQLREEGIPNSAIARALNVAPSAVSNLFTGARSLKLDEANKLMQLLPRKAGAWEVPVIGMAGAGAWLEAISDAKFMLQLALHKGADVSGKFAVEIVGDSMNLLLPEGSLAVVDPDDTRLFSGKVYLLLNSDGEATVKRYRTDPARFEPVSDNTEYVPFELGTTDFRVIGRVTYGVQKF